MAGVGGDDRGQGWDMRSSTGPGAPTGTASIRAVQPLSSPSEGFRPSGFSFERPAMATALGEVNDDIDGRGFAMPVLPEVSTLPKSIPHTKTRTKTDSAGDDECGERLASSKDDTFSFPAIPAPHVTATSFTFPQSKSLAARKYSEGNKDVHRPSNTFSKSQPEQLVMPGPFNMPLVVPEVTVVPSTPIGEETFRYGHSSTGSAYGLGFGFGSGSGLADSNNSFGEGHEREPIMQGGEDFAFPSFPTAFAREDLDVSEKEVDIDSGTERKAGENESVVAGSGDGRVNDDEKSRFTGFTFGTARLGSSPPPSSTGQVPTTEQEKPTLDAKRRRHSHTRSTSISTRAAFIPNTSVSALLLSAETTGRALSRSPSPSEHAIDLHGGEQQETAEERQRTLFALEGRHGRVLSPSAGGEGDAPRWLAGLQAFTGVGGTGAAEGNRTSKRSSRRRSRIGGVSETTTVEIALPPMDDDDLPSSFVVVGQGQGEAGFTGGLTSESCQLV